MFWIAVLVTLAVTILSIYLCLRWTYYTLHGAVPGLSPEFLFGNLCSSVLSILVEKCSTRTFMAVRNYTNGSVMSFNSGWVHIIVMFFCRPEHLEEIYSDRHRFERGNIRTKTFGLIAENMLITLTGWKYKRHAKAVLPMLRKARFRSQTSLIAERADQLIEIWRIRASKAEKDTIVTSIVSDLQQLMLDTFTFLTFDYDFGNLKDLLQAAFNAELTDLGKR